MLELLCCVFIKGFVFSSNIDLPSSLVTVHLRNFKGGRNGVAIYIYIYVIGLRGCTGQSSKFASFNVCSWFFLCLSVFFGSLGFC